jgi:hypothetical protein
VTHTVIRWLRRRRIPYYNGTGEQRAAYREWHLDVIAHNRRLLEARIGREELERRDRLFLESSQRLRESARARGYTGGLGG